MAIALDTSTDGGSTTGLSHSFNHTCTGTELVLLVAIDCNNLNNNDIITAVTYNSVAMTRVNSSSPGHGQSALYILAGPDTGTNSVAITINESVTIWAVAASYTGCSQGGQPHKQASTAGDPTTSVSQSVTTTTDNCWVVSASGRKAESGSAVLSAGTGVTSRKVNGGIAIGDSNGPKTPAGAYSSTWNINSSTGISILVAAIAPSIPGLSIFEAPGQSGMQTPGVKLWP